jgi:hypothetical protein
MAKNPTNEKTSKTTSKADVPPMFGTKPNVADGPPAAPTVKSTVGEKKNYNLAGYTQYHVATIEATATPKGYRARIGFVGPEGHVFFNSEHQDFDDAERMVNFVREGKKSGRLYNIFAKTLEVHTSPGPPPVTVVEVLGLIYSYTLPS